MAKDDMAGFDSKEQKADQLEALKVEYALLTQRGNDRAKEVAAYAKAHHGETLTVAKAKADAKAAAEDDA
jgi:hypothetical protein